MFALVKFPPISFHVWKFLAGVVLSVTASIITVPSVLDPEFSDPAYRMGIGIIVTMWLCSAIFFRNSVLPWAGTRFAWPDKPVSKRLEWRLNRNPVQPLDIVMMLSAVLTIGLVVYAMLPSPHWQSTAFVVSTAFMFFWTVVLYGLQFMPDKPWIDNLVQAVGLASAVTTCLILGLQPV